MGFVIQVEKSPTKGAAAFIGNYLKKATN